MSTVNIRHQFMRSKTGIAGIAILSILGTMSVATMLVVPAETFEQWNNPGKWIDHPKVAMPAWINLLESKKIPEHQIIDRYTMAVEDTGLLNTRVIRHVVDFEYDEFPNDFIYNLQLQYTSSPLMEITIIRPDGASLKILQTSLPLIYEYSEHHQRTFSTDAQIKKNMFLQSDMFAFDIDELPAEEIIFSSLHVHEVLKGKYTFVISILNQDDVHIDHSQMIIGGKIFGLMGTDELRRDLLTGLLWGTPLALFIGIAVATGSVVIGLIYGVYAGYTGRKTDEAMMRFNDVIYALPALPFLIILAVTISSSIFVMIGFLTIFGWVGIAKVSRSMALQTKTRGYIDAAQVMGQSRTKIIFKHIIPQMLPYAFASIAISVPAAITTEAGLSFLGLGDPSFPTWGQILHDASKYGAASRGLWWWIVPPGIMIAITGLAFVFIGNALDKIANPRLNR